MHYMTYEERLQLEALLKAKVPVARIAKILGFTRRTIYNEIRRGAYTHMRTEDLRIERRYSAVKGQDLHNKAQRHKGREKKGISDPDYMDFLAYMIKRQHYSPAAALAAAQRAGYQTTICRNTLYTYIETGFFKHLGNIDLPEKVSRRTKKAGRKSRVAHPKLPSIEQRPEWVNDRSEVGHWEMDLVIGKKEAAPCLLTLTERCSRRELIRKIPNKQAASIRAVFNQLEKQMGKKKFRETFRSLTTDNGSEFLEYNQLRKSIYKGNRFDVWYCHSYAAWEKGTNENHNRMIRRFFPKGTDFAKVSPKRIQEVEDWMNNYPRKIFNWATPNEMAGPSRG